MCARARRVLSPRRLVSGVERVRFFLKRELYCAGAVAAARSSISCCSFLGFFAVVFPDTVSLKWARKRPRPFFFLAAFEPILTPRWAILRKELAHGLAPYATAQHSKTECVFASPNRHVESGVVLRECSGCSSGLKRGAMRTRPVQTTRSSNSPHLVSFLFLGLFACSPGNPTPFLCCRK